MKLNALVNLTTLKVTTAFIMTIAMTSALTACAPDNEQQTQTPVAQTVKLAPVITNAKQYTRTFPAEVAAVKTINLSFEVSGRLINTKLQTGSVVNEGEILAKIDPTLFKQRVQEAQTRLNQAARDLKRIEATAENGLASQSQLDNAKTNFELAEIALSKAEQDLSYTALSAPFNAQVSERFVEKGNFVKAGDIIAKLQDVSLFYFNVNVPERLLSNYQQGSLVKTEAHIISTPEKKYELTYIEHDTQPDPITQTYKVVFAAQVSDNSLTPGARAIVKVSLEDNAKDDVMLVPFNALQGSNADGFHVWVYNKANSTVQKRTVKVLKVDDNMAAITKGLNKDDLVVAAGAPKMREGLAVKPYKAEL
ncbi:efflux RND transporter periplasmic adaptor subunit [Pseudoalteromonas phenolica]|nr:efflux RND transporter periplasmic adaptor subunit [Pseudoalteromonas phenolica]